MEDSENTGITPETYKFAFDNLPGIENKTGFEAYQCFRDFVIQLLFQPERAKEFVAKEDQYNLLSEFKLIDAAYVDNFNASVSLKLEAPHIYDETIKIIDKYVRPDVRNEGLNHLYQESSAFLVLILNCYEDISIRQGLHIAHHLTGYSESIIETSYRSRMKGLESKLNGNLPSAIELAALYWTIHTKKANPDTLKPIAIGSKRSKNESLKAIDGYWSFTQKVAQHYQNRVIGYLNNNPISLFNDEAQKFGFEFPLRDAQLQRPSAHIVFFILCASIAVEFMPELLRSYGETAPKVP